MSSRLAAATGIAFMTTVFAACAEDSARSPQRPQPHPSRAVRLSMEGLSIVSTGTQAAGRRKCQSIMLLPSEQLAVAGDRLMASLEGQLISRGLRVVSSAVTAKVVSDPGRERNAVEGAAKLPMIERAMVLAKDANVDCVFQLFTFDTGERWRRYFVWLPEQLALTEKDEASYLGAPQGRRWFVDGPVWQINGKVIEVERGTVLAVVGLAASTVGRAQTFSLQEVDGSLQVVAGQSGWNLSRPEDLKILGAVIMSQLATDIRGTGPEEEGK